MRRPTGLLKHSAYLSQGRQRQRSPQLVATADNWSSLCLGHALVSLGFAARQPGLASDGLALAVNPGQCAAAGYGGDRRRPVTGGAVRGSRRAVGLVSEGRGGSHSTICVMQGTPSPPTLARACVLELLAVPTAEDALGHEPLP
jgi:hypothetical protein